MNEASFRRPDIDSSFWQRPSNHQHSKIVLGFLFSFFYGGIEYGIFLLPSLTFAIPVRCIQSKAVVIHLIGNILLFEATCLDYGTAARSRNWNCFHLICSKPHTSVLGNFLGVVR
jgi:hypothetical protein